MNRTPFWTYFYFYEKQTEKTTSHYISNYFFTDLFPISRHCECVSFQKVALNISKTIQFIGRVVFHTLHNLHCVTFFPFCTTPFIFMFLDSMPKNAKLNLWSCFFYKKKNGFFVFWYNIMWHRCIPETWDSASSSVGVFSKPPKPHLVKKSKLIRLREQTSRRRRVTNRMPRRRIISERTRRFLKERK